MMYIYFELAIVTGLLFFINLKLLLRIKTISKVWFQKISQKESNIVFSALIAIVLSLYLTFDRKAFKSCYVCSHILCLVFFFNHVVELLASKYPITALLCLTIMKDLRFYGYECWMWIQCRFHQTIFTLCIPQGASSLTPGILFVWVKCLVLSARLNCTQVIVVAFQLC